MSARIDIWFLAMKSHRMSHTRGGGDIAVSPDADARALFGDMACCRAPGPQGGGNCPSLMERLSRVQL